MDNILLSFSLEPLYLVQVLLINVLHIYYFQQVLEVKYVMPFHMISVNLSWICQHNLTLPYAKILMHAYQMAVLILIAKIYGLENLSFIWSIWPGYGNKICNKLYLNLLCKLFLINETRTQSKLKMRVFPQFHLSVQLIQYSFLVYETPRILKRSLASYFEEIIISGFIDVDKLVVNLFIIQLHSEE